MMYDLDSFTYESDTQRSVLQSVEDIGISNMFMRARIGQRVITILPDDGNHLNISVEDGEGNTDVLGIRQFVGYAIFHNFPSEAADLLTLAFIESRDTHTTDGSVATRLSNSPVFGSAIFEGNLASNAIRSALGQRRITLNDDPEFIRLVGLVTYLKISADNIGEELDGEVNISRQSKGMSKAEAVSNKHGFNCDMSVNGSEKTLGSNADQSEIEDVILWAKEHGIEEQLAEVLVEFFLLKYHPMEWMAFMERYGNLSQKDGYVGRTVEALHRFRHLGVANYTSEPRFINDLIGFALPGYLSQFDIDLSLSDMQDEYRLLKHNLLVLLTGKQRHDSNQLRTEFSLLPIQFPMAEHSFKEEYPLPNANTIELKYKGTDGNYYTVMVEFDGVTPRVLFNDFTNCPNPDDLILTLIFLVNEHMTLSRYLTGERYFWREYDYRKFENYNWGSGEGIEYSNGEGVGLSFVVDDQDEYERELPLGELRRIYTGSSLDKIVSALQDYDLLDPEYRERHLEVFRAMLSQFKFPKREFKFRRNGRLDIKGIKFSVVSR